MPLEFEIAPGRMIGGDHPCFIIAEIGQNHQGDINIAKQLIKVAKEAGADCAKFQKSELSHKFNKAALARPYTTKNSWGKTYGEHKEYLEFSHEQYHELQQYATEIGIFFTASGMDEAAADFLHELGVPFFKIGSGDTNNLKYVAETAKKGRPMVVSSGMQSLETMHKVYKAVKETNDKLCILQCTSAYPLAPEDVNLRVIQDVNLRVIQTYQKEFPDIPIGYSGHESGVTITLGAVALGAKVVERHITMDKTWKGSDHEASLGYGSGVNITLGAVALGANVVERHITMDKTWKGSDHEASLEPDELKDLVNQIRILERSMGNGVKTMRECETFTFTKLGKSVVAAKAIPSGTELTYDLLTVKVAEPKGYPPEIMANLIGKRTKRALEYDESVREEDVLMQ